MIYGYSRNVVNEYGLLELQEITFAMDAERLRTVARFLLEMANEMSSSGELSSSWHRHLSGWSLEWARLEGEADVIVMPNAEQPSA